MTEEFPEVRGIRKIPKEAIEGRKAAHYCFGKIHDFQLKHKKHPPAVRQFNEATFTYPDNSAWVVPVYRHFNLSEHRQFEVSFDDENRQVENGLYSAWVRWGIREKNMPSMDVVTCYSDLEVSNLDYIIDVFDAFILDWLPLGEFKARCKATY